jgi:hypothetical protein
MCRTEISVFTTVLFPKIMLFKDLCSFLSISFLVIECIIILFQQFDTMANMENSDAEFMNVKFC